MKSKFFEYLDTNDNLIENQKPYDLVLLKCIFERINTSGQANVLDVMRRYKTYYSYQKNLGFVFDNLVEENIEKATTKDLWEQIKSQSYKNINEKGFLRIINKGGENYYFALPMSLIIELRPNDYKVISKKIEEKLNEYLDKYKMDKNTITVSNSKKDIDTKPIVDIKQIIDIKQKVHSKRTQTPFEKLKKRILKYFPKKKFVGDITINDDEYDLLVEYLNIKYKSMISAYNHTIIDPILATALVQIGIRNYNGKFWSHVSRILEVDQINPNQQGWLGDSFVVTLKKYDKISLGENEKVSNILMHGFVSDNYANDFFNFLFTYYRIDLERDIQRMDSSATQTLMDVMTRNDNRGRTYFLVQQTADAVRSNARGCKIRIRRFLRLIDKCFWDERILVNSPNRLTQRFNSWQESSQDFQIEYNKFNGGNYKGCGKKNFSSPYFKCDLKKISFELILPTQLVKFEDAKNLSWRILINDEVKVIKTELVQAVTGYKTEKESIKIYNTAIFDTIIIELVNATTKIRTFKIKDDCIRFFDKDGDFVKTDAVSSGEIYAFSDSTATVSSPALIENDKCGKLMLLYFDFQYGDIVRLPDGKPLSIGKKIEEGLIQRGKLKNVYALVDEEQIPIYKSMPSVLIKMKKNRAKGTMIKINDNIYRMFDKETIEIELKDRSGETGYLINLGDFDCGENGIYEIYIDVPNDRKNRYWKFAHINGIEYHFEDSPYIFKTRGTINFNSQLQVKGNNETEKIKGENTFNFNISPNQKELSFEAITSNGNILLNFEIPVLNWKFDNSEWQIEKPSEIWHNDFPTKISFMYPEDKIKLSMDENYESDDYSEQTYSYVKLKEKNIIECDVTRFKSWFGREIALRTLYVDTSAERIPFIDIVTKSTVVSALVKGDFEKSVLIGEFDIIGNANYYADIEYDGKIIFSKVRLIKGKFEVNSKLQSGVYKVSLFEDEDDDTGFGEAIYIPIGKTHYCELVNPYNLQGASIKINSIKKGEKNSFNMMLSCSYKVKNLTRVSKHDNHKYTGNLIALGIHEKALDNIRVNVEFYDLNKLKYCYITFLDSGELIEFLYDTYQKKIVKDEAKHLAASLRYRIYEVIYPEDYVYVVEFVNNSYESKRIVNKANYINEAAVAIDEKWDISSGKNESIDTQIVWKGYAANKDKDADSIDTLFSDIKISVVLHNCLLRSKFLTIRDIKELIDEKGINAIDSIKMLRKNSKSELIDILRKFKVI